MTTISECDLYSVKTWKFLNKCIYDHNLVTIAVEARLEQFEKGEANYNKLTSNDL